jgi:hypothetical protein
VPRLKSNERTEIVSDRDAGPAGASRTVCRVTEVPVVYSPWYIVGVFLANGIGCVLTVFCLVRMTDKRRSVANRAFLVFVAAWIIVETARDDMLFVAATAIHLEDSQVRFFIVPSMLLTVVAVLFTAAILGAAARNPRPLWTAGGGAAIGLLIGAVNVQAATSGRTGAATSIDPVDSAVIVLVLAAVIAITIRLATGATTRPPMAGSIMLLAICLTIAQYLTVGEVLTDPSVPGDYDAGLDSIPLIAFTAVAFGIRTIALTVLSITDEGDLELPTAAGDRQLPPGRARHPFE